MPSRANKERRLAKNVELNTARSVKAWEEETGKSATPEVKEEYRKMFVDSAERVDTRLDSVWNSKSEGSDDFKRPDLGFFGGVDFDKNGRIIRGS